MLVHASGITDEGHAATVISDGGALGALCKARRWHVAVLGKADGHQNCVEFSHWSSPFVFWPWPAEWGPPWSTLTNRLRMTATYNRACCWLLDTVRLTSCWCASPF